VQEEEEPEEQTTPRPDRTESPLGEGAEEFLAAELTEVAQQAGDPETEIGALPLPIPEPPEPTEQIDPSPIWREPTEVEMDPDPVDRGGLDNPIEEMEASPIPIPDPALGSPVDEVSGIPLPLPDPGMEAEFGEVGAHPIPAPYEADLVEDNLAAGLDEELFEEPLE
jgi:hypothetical protein